MFALLLHYIDIPFSCLATKKLPLILINYSTFYMSSMKIVLRFIGRKSKSSPWKRPLFVAKIYFHYYDTSVANEAKSLCEILKQ